MAGDDTSIGAIRKRTTKLLADWGADFSVILKELEENRARLQELEAAAAGQSDEVETLNRRIEAQDTLIASLQSEADETATLLETSLDWHVTTVSELQQSVTAWKSQYAALKSLNPSSESTIAAPEASEASEPTEEQQPAPESADDVSENKLDATSPHNMREALSEAQQMAGRRK